MLAAERMQLTLLKLACLFYLKSNCAADITGSASARAQLGLKDSCLAV